MSPEKKPENEVVDGFHRDWSFLPVDLVGLITARLFVLEDTIFRAVCKTWQSAPTDYWDTASPWLFYRCRNQNSCTVISPLTGQSLDINLPSQLAGCEIRSCREGWLLFEHRVSHVNLILFNPLTREIIDGIPQPPILFENIWFKPPSAGKCTIVGFRAYLKGVKIAIWKFGDKKWTSYRVQLEEPYSHGLNGGPIMTRLGKKFYVMGADGSLGVFNPNDVLYSFRHWDISVPMNNSGEYHAAYGSPCYLVETNGGRLYSVFETIPDRSIRIFSLNLKKRLWEEVHHLGNQTFFLSNGRCFSKVLRINKLRNKIFFPKFADDMSYMLYCPLTRKFSSLNAQLSTCTAMKLRDFPNACWFTN